MIKKKQTSLSKKLLNQRTQHSIPSNYPSPKQPTPNQQLKRANQFIEHYHLLKQQHAFNSGQKNLLQEASRADSNHDDEFCFDVDLGVPYVESQHLDSGFEFDYQRSGSKEQVGFPKVSSAKEIFTSVLDLSQDGNSQLEEENFTDRQKADQQEQRTFHNLDNDQKSSQFNRKSRSRKEVPQIINFEDYYNQNQSDKCVRMGKPLSFIIDDVFCTDAKEDKLKIMQKLKITSQFRKEKLKFWNDKLVELNKSQTQPYDLSKSFLPNQQNYSSSINSYCAQSPTFLNDEKKKAQTVKPTPKRSKFQKQPASTKRAQINLIKLEPTTQNNTKIGHNKKESSLSPMKRKQQTKQSTIHQRNNSNNSHKTIQAIQPMSRKPKPHNHNTINNKQNEQGYCANSPANNTYYHHNSHNEQVHNKRQQLLQLNKPSRSKDKSLVQKVL